MKPGRFKVALVHHHDWILTKERTTEGFQRWIGRDKRVATAYIKVAPQALDHIAVGMCSLTTRSRRSTAMRHDR